jgi:hypothetical protein
VLVSGNGVSIENERIGMIRAIVLTRGNQLNVIARDGANNAQLSSLVENWGLIKGLDVAISGGDGHESIINHGSIVGDIVLGAGADTFVFGKGGDLSGHLFLGEGNDLVYIETGSGTSRIDDFTTTFDDINVSAFYSNFDDLVAHSEQNSSDTIINLDHSDQLVLIGVTALHPGDFSFV